MGWIPDIPSAKDYTSASPKVQPLLARLRSKRPGPPPSSVILEGDFPPVENQGPIQSCTAHAGVALLEYFYRKAIQQTIGPMGNASRMFLYKVTRNLLNRPNLDSGAFLRTTMEAMRLIGVAPEDVWPYVPESLYVEPPAFIYALAGNYKATTYFRLDPEGSSNEETLQEVKLALSLAGCGKTSIPH